MFENIHGELNVPWIVLLLHEYNHKREREKKKGERAHIFFSSRDLEKASSSALFIYIRKLIKYNVSVYLVCVSKASCVYIEREAHITFNE